MKTLPFSLFTLLCLPGGQAWAITLVPTADTYVAQSAATSNFGTATSLSPLNNGTGTSNRDAYLKFDISGVTTIASARLRINAALGALSASSDTYTCPISAWSVADTTWGETTMTWNNRPTLGAVLNNEDVTGIQPAPAAQWVEIDVTAYLQSQKAASQNIISIGLHNPDAFSLSTTIGSRESANPPQLVVTTSAPVETDSSYYVSTTGNDANTGTLAQPFRTIQRAASLMIHGDTCYIRGGTYRETVTPANSGTVAAPITFRPYGSEVVTVSGAEVVSDWTVHSGGIYKASLTGALGNKDQIFVDGQMMNLARWPNTSLDVSRPVKAIAATGAFNTTANGDGTNTGTYTDPALTQAAGFFNGAKIHFVPGAVWNAQTGTVTSYTPGSVQFTWLYSGSTSNAPQASNPYFLFGLLSLLDTPGEWFMDAPANVLYLWPPQNDSPENHVVEVRRRDVGLDLSGRSYISAQGLNFFACKVTSSAGSQYLALDSLSLRYISHFSIIAHGNDPQEDTGVTLRGTHHTLSNSEIALSAGDGVTLWGDHHLVDNCVIHDVNYMDGDKAAVNTTRRFYSGSDLQSTSTDHEIRYNTCYNSGRALVLCGAFRRVSVHNNRLLRSMLGTQDSGAIYTYGHDGENTDLSYNFIHDNVAIFGASGIYLDEGSSNFHVHHNVLYNNYLALQSNPPSLNILSYNNTASAFYYSFRTGAQVGSQAGTEVRNSIFTSAFNIDADAVASNNLLSTQDPQFVAPASLDFRIQAGSPAHDGGAALPPYTNGFEGTAPDIGALEFGQTWTAGSSLATRIPAGPTNLTATVAGSQVQLAWIDHASGTAGFVVERSQDYHTFAVLARLPATTTSYTDQTPVAGPYYYRVRAGESPYSNYPSVTIAGRDAFATIQAESLDSSNGVTVNSNTINSNNGSSNWAKYGAVNFGDGANQITLQMTTFSALTTNFLEVHLGSPTGARIANVNILGANGVPTSLSAATTLTSGVQDVYLVFKGSLSWFLDYFSFNPSSPVLPSPPTALVATTVSETVLHLAWTAPAGGADGFKIERSSDNQTFTEIDTVVVGATSFSDTGLTPGTTFYYRLRTYSLRGFSDYTAPASATTVPDTTPPALSPMTIASTNLSTGWARLGDTVTLSFSASEPIQTPSVMLLGVAAVVSNSSGNDWVATTNVTGGTAQGTVAFSVIATDLAGNTATAVTATSNGSGVTVDKTTPVLNLPANIVTEATSAAGRAVGYTPGATDNLDPFPGLSVAPVSGSTFPLGTTVITVTATDVAGNTASGSFTVTVQDTIAPMVTPPANVIAEPTSPAGAVVNYGVATATDAVGVTSLTYSQNTGTTFPIGATMVAVTAKDAAGNTGTATFTVTVRDTTAPMITPPANVTVAAASSAGATVTYDTATAADAVGVTSLTYSQNSGTIFAIGTTTVIITAKDAASNTGTATFAVTVTALTPLQAWRELYFDTINNSGDAADTADPNNNRIPNLLEYALNGNPVGDITGASVLPQPSLSGANRLQLAFARRLDRTDIISTVQGADSPAGPWTDLASSAGGEAFTVLASGATVNEAGASNTRVVIVGDLYPTTDPMHPFRFMRLKIARPD